MVSRAADSWTRDPPVRKSDILKTREKAFRIRVTFATENFVAVGGELIDRFPWHAAVPPLRDDGGFSSLPVSLDVRSPAIAGRRWLNERQKRHLESRETP